MLVRYLFQWAAQRASPTAWIDPDGSAVSWATLAHAVVETAGRLAEAGVGPDRCVPVQVPNRWEAVSLALALDYLAAIESPLDHRLSEAEVRSRAVALDAPLVVTEARRWVPTIADCRPLTETEMAAAAAECESQIDPNRPRLVLWTSGSTGTAKGVVLCSGALEANARGKLGAAPQTSADLRLTVLPLAHAYARTCDFGTWLLTGGTLSAVDGWAGLVTAGPRVRPTVMNGVPYLIDKMFEGIPAGQNVPGSSSGRERLMQLGMDRLRMLGCGGAAMEAERFEQLRSAGITVIQGYGLTEAGPVVCSATPEDGRAGIVGRPIEGTEIRLDEAGQVLCRGPGLMSGYWGDPTATAQRLHEGWLRTGDRGQIDSEGRLRVLGRIDNVIVLSTGRKVSPEPIEQRLAKVPGVRHVVLSGCGAGLAAWVDAEPGVSAEGLQAGFAEQLRGDLQEHQVRRVILLTRPLSVERGELTIKGTVCRQRVLQMIESAAG